MGLDFTSIPDRDGAALYLLHTSSTLEVQELEHLKSELSSQCDNQVILVDVNTPDGEQIRDFYDIDAAQLPVAMIIGDDDQVHSQWASTEIPAADVIAYSLRQISA